MFFFVSVSRRLSCRAVKTASPVSTVLGAPARLISANER